MTSMNKQRQRQIRNTQVDKLIAVLSDGRWHTTKELVRRVGHAFGGAKFVLTTSGIQVERRRHPSQRWQYQYRVDLSNPLGYANGDPEIGTAEPSRH